MKTKCPKCTRVLSVGEHPYKCRICGAECCTSCSDTGEQNAVICDGCLVYYEGQTQGSVHVVPNAKVQTAEPPTLEKP